MAERKYSMAAQQSFNLRGPDIVPLSHNPYKTVLKHPCKGEFRLLSGLGRTAYAWVVHAVRCETCKEVFAQHTEIYEAMHMYLETAHG